MFNYKLVVINVIKGIPKYPPSIGTPLLSGASTSPNGVVDVNP